MRIRHEGKRHGLPVRAGLAMMAVVLVAACGSASGGSASGGGRSPIIVGASASLSGDFSADGQAAQQGYELWADYINSHGGLLGRKVRLDILNDASNPAQAITDYQKLAGSDHVQILLGPFSTFLTKAVSVVAKRYGYAFFTGMGGGPYIVQQGLTNVVNIDPDGTKLMDVFTRDVPSFRPAPRTAAYVTQNDPFTQPEVQEAQSILQSEGIKTVLFKTYPAETTDFTPIAEAVVAAKPDIVVAGTALPDLLAFIKTFRQQNFNPKALIAAGGADAGQQFTQGVGGASAAEGIMIPEVWAASLSTRLNQWFVQAYLHRYGGTTAAISTTAAEAFATAQVAGEVVSATRSLDQQRLLAYAFSHTIESVFGPVQISQQSKANVAGGIFLTQWRNGSLQVVLPSRYATTGFEYPKPVWPGS